ncbi:MAG: beta galactosidase jelly roll domain-containing protein, partial [Prevotella sp.]|nr:beta galactosidase jelly roll domain-containing protein [Prevotella sp.]
MKRLTLLICLLTLCTVISQARNRRCFDDDWLFILGNDDKMSQVDYNDSQWRRLDLPHDWAIEGDFSVSNPSGAGGGALPGGIGWYRKHFQLTDGDKYERFFIEFDGVYMNSTVYLNGHQLGFRPYGYSSFEYDLTPYLNKTGDNVLSVKVDNSDQPNSRWYSGCGIYRHVWLTMTHSLHVAHWGTHVETTANGNVTITVDLRNESPLTTKPMIRHTIFDAQGKVVSTKVGQATTQQLKVKKPVLWSIDNPYV